ncbi:MAG: asparagine synthase (glutamine-hydrolyzing) [Anaerolineae bacterium]|nr:asparagine synthase (glutamine-hydrolyzing) [Anaerolineae bacterium]
MCGIVGILGLTKQIPIEETTLRQMLSMIRHRGPDQFGIYLDHQIGLGSARLSIIDLYSGQQPIANEDSMAWIVFNGEIYNFVELRAELEALGHRFATQTDTEVILHLYEELGPACVKRLNGQFAFAIWDAREQKLLLARDRLGIRPLFYTVVDGALIFGSEIKAILAAPRVQAEIDPVALDQIFSCWSTLSPRTAFTGILDVPPAHYLLAQRGEFTTRAYWQLTFPNSENSSTSRAGPDSQDVSEYLDSFRTLLIDATQIRLRADVPVGAYLSGGLDSSTIATITRNTIGSRLDTFSITFSDPDFDESAHQFRMASYLGTDHQVVHITHADIGRVFPEVIWHTEIPILRTSPAPMFLLSKLVRDNAFKVVLTGEGADEFLGGYDIFKEAKIRRFWAREPESQLRPLLLKRLYSDIPSLSANNGAYLTAFFRLGLTDVGRPDYSHALRWHNTSRAKRFFSDELRDAVKHGYARLADEPSAMSIQYPPEFMQWNPLHRAQYLESTIFMAQYLLSSQGDRMAMAHSVEGRFPFLDHRLVEFANRLPPALKLRGLTEKYILKKLAEQWLPSDVWRRPKRPYRAPIHRGFFNDTTPDYVRELLSPEKLNETGLFKTKAVEQLVLKIERGVPISETDDMALAGILSSQLVHQQFIRDFSRAAPLSEADDVKVCLGAGIS